MTSEDDKHMVIEDLRASLSLLRHENTFLKTELGLTIQKNQREANELKSSQQVKEEKLLDIIKKHEKEKNSLQDSHMQELKRLQQSNLQLSQKIKLYEDEMNTIHEDHEKRHHLNQRELSDLKMLIKEKDKEADNLKNLNLELKERVHVLEVDVNKERTHSQELEMDLSSKNHQMNLLKSRFDEIEHHYQTELNTAKAEVEKYRNLTKSGEEGLLKLNEDLKEEVELKMTQLLEERQKVAAAERDMEKTVSSLKQKHLSEIRSLSQENNELLKRIQQGTVGTSAVPEDGMKEELLRNIEELTKQISFMKKEKLVLLGKDAECETLKGAAKEDKKVSSNLQLELKEMMLQLSKLAKEASDLKVMNKGLSESLSNKEKVMNELAQDLAKERSMHNQMVTESKLKGEEKMAEYFARISSLEAQLAKRANDHSKESKTLKEKSKLYKANIRKLRFRLESTKLKMEELRARFTTFQEDFVPSYRYRLLQAHVQQMQNKHSEFKAFIQGLGSNHENWKEMDDLTSRVSFIGKKLKELEMEQEEAYSALEGL